MMFFLINYDREQGRLIALHEFTEAESATASLARLDLEIELNRSGVEREIVLLEAASIHDLKRTHRRYFASIAELTRPAAPSKTNE